MDFKYRMGICVFSLDLLIENLVYLEYQRPKRKYEINPIALYDRISSEI